jgi:hypothetical protein
MRTAETELKPVQIGEIEEEIVNLEAIEIVVGIEIGSEVETEIVIETEVQDEIETEALIEVLTVV